jgi:MraZ protein
LTLDAAGRVNLPKTLLDAMGISGSTEIILACQIDKIELWAKSDYEAALDEDLEDFAVLAAEVMAGSNRREDGK